MKNVLILKILIIINIFNKVLTQFNSQVTNNFNTLYVNNYNDNQNLNLNLNNRETENYQTVLYTTNQNPILNPAVQQHETSQYYASEVQPQPYTIATKIAQGEIINQPTRSDQINYQNNQHERSKQYFSNLNNEQQGRSRPGETEYTSSNNAPKRRSAQQQQYNSNERNQDQYSEASQYFSNEQQSQEVTDYNVNKSGPRGRALGHQKNGKNGNINRLTKGNSLNAKLKNINKFANNYNGELSDDVLNTNKPQFQYQYSQGWSTKEDIKRNKFVKPHLEYHKNSKYSAPNAPEDQYYQKFYNIYNDVENNKRTQDLSENDMESIKDDFNGRSIVAPGQYPHMAAIGFLSNEERIEFKCGGSLISESFVITAAHCCSLSGETPIIVKLGIINLKNQTGNTEPQRKAIKEIIIHPSYNASMNYHDIALLKLQSPVEFTKFVRPILLWASDSIPYERVFTMGYGSTSFAKAPTNILTELSLSLIPLQKCKQTLPSDEKTPYGILDSQLCGRDLEQNRDTCQGDSGGPLQLNLEQRNKRNFYRYYLVGIISYGEFCGSKKPGVYTRVSSYCHWIASIVWPEYFQGFQ